MSQWCLLLMFASPGAGGVWLAIETGSALSAVPAVAALGGCVWAGVGLHAVRRWRAVQGQLRGLELVLAPGYVRYTCRAGQWSVPWTAVRQVAVDLRPDRRLGQVLVLLIEVDGWGGPLAEYQRRCQLQMALDGVDVDWQAFGDLVNTASDGRFTSDPPAHPEPHLPSMATPVGVRPGGGR